MAKLVTLAIDGLQISVPAGTLLVNAAKQAGIDIPVFCYHPKMEPVAMCRQCMVEVGRPVIDRLTGLPVTENGKPKINFGLKLETACTTSVSEGMQVLTRSDKARAAQKANLEFLLTSHPLDCPVCDKGGECPLQNLTMAHASPQSRYLFDEKHHGEKHFPLGDLIWLDRERCIQCARCIRFQDSIAGEAVLAFYQRGRNTDIITNSEPGFDSVFSGNTTDICPVGALTTADFRFGARPWEMKASASICPHCPVGCNLALNTRREAASDGKIAVKRIMPRQNEAVNETWLCDKGRLAFHFAESADRLSRPLLLKDGKQSGAPWTESLQAAAQALFSAGKEAVILAGGRLANEDLFNLKQLADGLGAKALLFTHMAGGDLTTRLGVTAGTDLGTLGRGTVILVAASDLYHEAPLWYLRIKQAAGRGATLIVANGRDTRLERYAKFAVRYSYGDETRTIAGLPRQGQIGEALKAAENLLVFYGSDGLGLAGSAALATICADLVKDRRGRANNGLIGIWPRANDQGAWELGFQPAGDLKKIVTGKTVYIVAADPAGDDPQLKAALQGAKSVLVQDLFLTETAKLAQVVLPAQAWTEREGSFTSGERRVQCFYPAVPPVGETRADFAITAGIAKELGMQLEGRSAARVMDALVAAVEVYKGLSYRSLAETHEQWPIVGRSDLYYGGTTYENKQGLGVSLAPSAAAVVSAAATGKVEFLHPDEDHWLAVPVMRLYDLGITVSTSPLLHAHAGDRAVLLHPDMAKKLGCSEGDRLVVNGVEALVKLDGSVPASVALLPRSMGFAQDAPCVAEMKKA